MSGRVTPGFFVLPPELPEDEPPPDQSPERVMVTVNGSGDVSPAVLLFSSTVTIFDSTSETLLAALPLYV